MEVTRKQSTTNFLENYYFVLPDTHTYVCVSGGKKSLFCEKFGLFCFLDYSALRFAFLPYHRRIVNWNSMILSLKNCIDTHWKYQKTYHQYTFYDKVTLYTCDLFSWYPMRILARIGAKRRVHNNPINLAIYVSIKEKIGLTCDKLKKLL